MPLMTGQALSVAANSVSGNVLSGELYEFPSRDSAVRLLAAASAVGLRATLSIGGTVVINDQFISGANRFPIDPDDLLEEIGAFAGERLFLEFRNTTGGALTVNYMVKVTPVG